MSEPGYSAEEASTTRSFVNDGALRAACDAFVQELETLDHVPRRAPAHLRGLARQIGRELLADGGSYADLRELIRGLLHRALDHSRAHLAGATFPAEQSLLADVVNSALGSADVSRSVPLVDERRRD